LVWSHKGNKAATNGSALLLVGVPTPNQFSNWSISFLTASFMVSIIFASGRDNTFPSMKVCSEDFAK
ncbi:MAG: hypothetical protein FWD31_09750, partial [Planctomycetaceae bacterium]|nr:hypothetical protein [Planctomycetaceae bacterium]